MRKTLISAILALLCAFLLLSCATAEAPVPAPEEAPEKAPIEKADEYLAALYRSKAPKGQPEETKIDFDRVVKLNIKGISFDVAWAAEVVEGPADSVAVKPSKRANFATIDIDEKTTEPVRYNLVATITDAEGTAVQRSFAYEIPQMVDPDAALKVEKVAEFKAGKPYKFGMAQANLGKTLYLTGEMAGYYLATTDDPLAGADVFAEEAEGGFKLYLMEDGAKSYIDIYSRDVEKGKAGIRYNQEDGCVYTIDPDLGILVTENEAGKFYPGTYKDFDTFSASGYGFIKPENKGVSQFPGEFFKVAVPVQRTLVEAPAAGEACKYAIEQNNIGKVLYLNGQMAGDHYLGATDDPAEAVDVRLEEAEGGFLISLDGPEGKLYIDLFEYKSGKVGVHFASEPGVVFHMDENLGILVGEFGGQECYIGTYKDYDTFSASSTNYIKPENKGVSQFPAQFFKVAIPVQRTLVEAPAAGKAYKYALEQNNIGKVLYLNGQMVGDHYLGATENPAEAVDVRLEEAEGGFLVSLDGPEGKLYIDLFEYKSGKVGVHFASEPGVVFHMDENLGILVGEFGGQECYIGTYKDYDTFSASSTKYIKPDNKGVSQFPALFFIVK